MLLAVHAFCLGTAAQNAARPLTMAELKDITTYHSAQLGNTLSQKGDKLTFTYGCDIQNGTDLQLAEVDLALVFTDRETHKETCRSAPTRLTQFDNRRLPHVGALEPWSSLTTPLPNLNFSVPPEEWRSNVSGQIVAVRAITAPQPGDLHDIGNLIAYVKNHSEQEVLQAFERDPGLVSARDSKGTSACLVAMAYGTPAVVKAIVAKGGDLHARATTGEDAMFYATAGDKPANLDYALEQGFTPNLTLPSGETILERALSEWATHSISWLVTHGADLNQTDNLGFVPLMEAVFCHNKVAFDLFAKAGADPFRRSQWQLSLVHIAALYDPDFLQRALDLGVDIDDKAPPNDVTPLMLSAQAQTYASARWLLDHGANGRAVAKNGWGVLDFAQQGNTLHTDQFFLNDVGDPTKWHAKYPPKLSAPSSPPVAPVWNNAVLRFDCSLGSFESDLSYAPPIRGALQPARYTINPHLRTPFDLHEWSTACADTSSHSSAYPNIVFCHVDPVEQVVWKTTVAVTPHTRYDFVCWAYGVSDPLRCGSSLILRVSGIDSERSYVPFSHWGKFDQLWNSGVATSATLEILSAKEAKDQVFGISDVSINKL